MKKTLFAAFTMTIFSLGLGAQEITTIINQQKQKTMETNKNNSAVNHQFKPLPYAYDALEPYIDKMTMEIHYSRHHKAYFDNFIKAINGTPLEKMSMNELFENMSTLPAAVRNNGGGYYNHELFWENMAPGGVGMTERFEKMLKQQFGSVEKLKEEFANAGLTRFGSGWAWLNVDEKGNLFISSTPNQDNPLMDVAEKRGTPVLAMDVWEHAYYLKYQNKRVDYINAFWNIINWKVVEERYDEAVVKNK
ncbi:MAG TPA: superoxide dismutase [Bacteroidales bacterium]|nr:superoxide dismutase [Bacteroidales bacterium]HPB26429.1 superoxide dismutase [Bacteroidales bacterium]HPI31664.1 superoxide dismutase [Bacteroidales bacterium]HQN16655.1 superoxide dismutase [Bacteroidales bacterium]HQP16930.1 superoxide dismutase [Bacteroidales bacterium]